MDAPKRIQAMTETREAKLDAFIYQISAICRNPPPTGSYIPLREKILETIALGREDGIEQAAAECELLHAVHPRDSGREPNCAGLIRSLSSKREVKNG